MIKNIIFDIGGVIVDLDYDLTYSKLGEVMGFSITSTNMPAQIFKIILGYEKGEINTETFLWHLQKESSKLTPQPDKLIKAWNAMFLGWNPVRFRFLEELRKKYALFLLTNTNELHMEWLHRNMKKQQNISNFDTIFFDKAFYSHAMRMRKPEIKMYKQVLKEAGVKADETLIIDNNEQNADKARKAGFLASYHNPKDEIMDCLDRYLADHKI
jgi:putative hydrolase of the HAD superfamily